MLTSHGDNGPTKLDFALDMLKEQQLSIATKYESESILVLKGLWLLAVEPSADAVAKLNNSIGLVQVVHDMISGILCK